MGLAVPFHRKSGYMYLCTPNLKGSRFLNKSRLIWGLICIVGCVVSFFWFGAFLWVRDAQQQADRIMHLWDVRRDSLAGKTGFHDTRPETVPLSICPQVQSRSNFAVVSMLTVAKNGKRFHHFQASAAKLMVSIKTWSPGLHVDSILIVAIPLHERDSVDVPLLTGAGWTICFVDPIPSPPVQKSNRFLDSSMFSRFMIWKLVEYQAVLSMDTDMIVARDLSPLFSEFYRAIIKQGKQLAAVPDFPLPCPKTADLWLEPTFNGGLLLLTPGMELFKHLNHSIYTLDYDPEWAEQGLLNAFYPHGQYVELPAMYNAYTVKKFCSSTRWKAEEDDMAVIHYTAVKGWGLEIVNFGVIYDMITRHNEFNAWGCFMWNVVEYCCIWESIPITPHISTRPADEYQNRISTIRNEKNRLGA
jgi:hypothetical protein